MKKYVNFLWAFIFCMIMIPVVSMAQEVGGETQLDLTNFSANFANLAAFAAFVVAITSFLLKLFKNPNFVVLKTIRIQQLVSWGVAVALAFGGWWFKLGMFIEVNWVTTLLYGLAAGLIANGFKNIELIKLVLSWLKLGAKKKE